MKMEIILEAQIEKRKFWIDGIIRLSGDFVADAEKVEDELGQEIKFFVTGTGPQEEAHEAGGFSG